MLSDFIASLLEDKLKFTPTDDQKKLIHSLAEFITSSGQDEIFLLKGYAGTGKTTIVSLLTEVLPEVKIRTVMLAPTGRAAKVLTTYTGKQAFTIHKKIYRQKSSNDGFGEFTLDKNLHTNTIFIVDEASMISNSSYENSIFGSGRLLDDLIQYVFNDKNCKLILIGDSAQLPPVRLEISPALELKNLEGYGKKVYEMNLTNVVRQSKESGVLHNATYIRNLIPGYDQSYPKFTIEGFDDFIRIGGQDLIENLSDTYDKNGIKDTLVICRTNKRANRYNQGIRNSILWREEEISEGDYIMVVKNNYFWTETNEKISFIANGDVAEILKINGYEELYGYRFANVTIQLIDYEYIELDTKILLDTLYVEAPALTSEENRAFFFKVAEDYAEEKSRKKKYQKVRENPYFNALQVKFAYAVTCHKSQGGQWSTVFIDQGFITDDRLNIEFLRWLYTAVTRASKKIYLVNFKDEFFNDKQ